MKKRERFGSGQKVLQAFTGVHMILRPDPDLSGFFFFCHSSASSMLLPNAAAFIKIFRGSSVAFI